MKAQKLTLTLILTLIFSFLLCGIFVQPVKSQFLGSIYINPDGSVTGTDKIQRNGNIYTLTGNISDGLMVEKDNIMIDGAGFALKGSGEGRGLVLENRSNLIIKNMLITDFYYGIYLPKYNCTFEGNNITDCHNGIFLSSSSNNTFIQNTLANNTISLEITYGSDGNYYFENNVGHNQGLGIFLAGQNNVFDRNYWSDYDGSDDNGDGVGDAPYEVWEGYVDMRPLINPVIIPEFSSWIILPLFMIASLLIILVYFKKFKI